MKIQVLRTAAIISVCIAVLPVMWNADAADRSRDFQPPRADGPGRGFDEPDAAALHYWKKRQGGAPQLDAVAAYEKALAHLDRMPRYSTRLGAPLTGRPATGAPSVAKFIAARALGQWEALGPGNIGGWTRTLVIHPQHPEIMYAGGVSGGVWKTTDGGASSYACGFR